MSRPTRISFELVDNYISDAVSDTTGYGRVRSEIVRELLCGGLTQRQREYLILRYAKNMNGSEIARMYGVNRSTVCVTLSRARRRIARLLGAQKLRESFESYIDPCDE